MEKWRNQTNIDVGTAMGGGVTRAKKPNKNAAMPKVKVYIYKCENGHQRTESEKIADQPPCSTCHMTTGEIKRMNLARTTTKLAKPNKRRN